MAEKPSIPRDVADLLKASAEHLEKTKRSLEEGGAHVSSSSAAVERSKKRLKRPRDPLQLAKLIGDIATGAVEDRTEAKRGSAGGSKGGPARARKLTPEQREEIARLAAEARWKKSKD